MNIVALTPPVVVALLAGAALTYGKLSHNAQPKRLELIGSTRRLLVRPDTTPELADILRHHLRAAFGDHLFMLFAVATGFVAPLTFLSRKGYDELTRREYSDDEAQGAYDHVTKLSFDIAFANHPLLMSLFSTGLLTLGIPCFIVGSLLYGKGHRVAKVRKIAREIVLGTFNVAVPIGERFSLASHPLAMGR